MILVTHTHTHTHRHVCKQAQTLYLVHCEPLAQIQVHISDSQIVQYFHLQIQQVCGYCSSGHTYKYLYS